MIKYLNIIVRLKNQDRFAVRTKNKDLLVTN